MKHKKIDITNPPDHSLFSHQPNEEKLNVKVLVWQKYDDDDDDDTC